jgi:hypothetical protein
VNETYYTVADRRFFPGTVALLNSLRLTGHTGEMVVLDSGLTDEQRSRLERHARLERPPREAVEHPTLLKPYVHELHRDGIAVLIDADVVVVGPLDDLLAQAAGGRICACWDHPDATDRFFPEWVELFGLRSAVRPRTYVNAGFVAVGGETAPRLLRRWWETTEGLIDRPWVPDARDPAWDFDQDTLNALLMSEFAEVELVDLPHDMALPPELYRTKVLDPQTLETTLDGRPVRFLHYTGGPKPWNRHGWSRSRRDAYTALLPRLLFGSDVTLSLDPVDVPLWLRPTAPGAAALSALNVVNRGIRAVGSRVPPGMEARLRLLRSRLAKG